ncbi:MAG: hypothetical protein ACO20H_06320 [Bacteriovoracaceae bacterium]
MSSKKLIDIVYYGFDERLINVINQEKEDILEGSYDIDFREIKPQSNHNSLCTLILEDNFDLLMVDMYAPEIDSALRTLFFELNIKNTNIIGLWNQLDNKNLEQWRYELGIKTHFCYLQTQKSSIADLSLSIVKILGINNDKHEFFSKKVESELEVLLPLRVNYFSFDEIQVETDVPVYLNDTFKISINGLEDFPFEDFFATEVRTTNLRYPATYQITAQYAFYDKYDLLYFSDKDDLDDLQFLEKELGNSVTIENADEELIREILLEFHENKTKSYEKRNVIKRLVKNYSEGMADQGLRVLVIDKNFTVYKNAKKMVWLYPYKFLLVSTLEDNLNILNTSGAEIVSFVIDEPIPAQSFMESEEFVQLRVMCSRLKNNAISNKTPEPLVVIYNLTHDLNKLRKILDYSNLNPVDQEYSFDHQISLVREFVQEKERTRGVAYKNVDLGKVSPKYHSEFSHGFIIKNIDVDTISENEVVFQSRVFIEKYSSCLVRINKDIQFFATIVEVNKQNKERHYRALIHSLGEKEKQGLRKYIFAKEE